MVVESDAILFVELDLAPCGRSRLSPIHESEWSMLGMHLRRASRLGKPTINDLDRWASETKAYCDGTCFASIAER